MRTIERLNFESVLKSTRWLNWLPSHVIHYTVFV